MPKYRKKLIEIDLPLADINKESAREKSIRHGHPSTLHLWWSRKPLASCRAVLFASMVDDPSSYIDDPEEQKAERERLHRIISQLVEWENSNDADLLAEARLEIAKTIARQPDKPSISETVIPRDSQGGQIPASAGNDGAAHPDTVLKYLAEHAPTIYDPFCGGGSIPLEAQRLGMKAVGSDLNPVAVLITKALIEIPPKFANQPPINPDADPMGMTVGKGRKAQKLPWRGASGLADDIRYYGKWMREEAFKRIGHLYPTINDENDIERTVIAWLWTRTIPCSNPACNINMPLKTTFQLSKKANNQHWTKPVVNRETNTVSFHVQNHPTDVPTEATVYRQGATCIACNTSVRLDYVRQQAREGNMGEQMTAIVAEGDRKRLFISPTDEHVQTALSAEPEWKPSATLPEKALGFAVQNYGITNWHQLFTQRQLLTLTTFSDLISEVRSLIVQDSDDDYADAVCTYLTLAIGKSADYGSSFASWHNGRDVIGHVFTKQAISMIWDFAEVNQFSKSTANWIGTIEWVAKAVERLPAESNTGKVHQANASTTVHANDGPIIVTDPPYYANIGYADLSDFFYIWHRQSLRDIYPDLFAGMLTPKNEESVAAPIFDDPRQHFEEGLNKALKRIRQRCTDDYPSSIFYAYKQQEEERGGQTSTGWETMLNALIDSGFHIVGTWPMRTELSNRPRSLGSNALATSVILVCRPRPEDAPSITRQQFLDELADEMPKALDHLTREGHIAPTDLAQSAIGPGMEIYSKYSSVTYISGERFTVRDALVAINLEIQKYDQRETGDLDPESQFCVTWLKQHGFEEGEYGVAETLSKAKNIDVDDLSGTHEILTSENGKVQLHPIDYYHPTEHDPDLPIDDRGGEMTAWEACFRIAYHLDYGREDADDVRGAARVFNIKGSGIDMVERLARILYNYHDARGEAREAYPFNSIATRWNEVYAEASRLRTSRQESLT